MSKTYQIVDKAVAIQKLIEKNDPNETPWLSNVYSLACDISASARELDKDIEEIAKSTKELTE